MWKYLSNWVVDRCGQNFCTSTNMSTKNLSAPKAPGPFTRDYNEIKHAAKAVGRDEQFTSHRKGHRERSSSPSDRTGGHKARSEPKFEGGGRKKDEKKETIHEFPENNSSFRVGSAIISANASETRSGETTMNSEMRGTVPLYGIPSKTNEVQTEKGSKASKVYGMSPVEGSVLSPGKLTMISPSLNPSEYHKMYQVGDMMKGKVNAKELQAAFEVFQGKHFSDASCKFVVRLFDLDKAGGLDTKEFETLYFFVKQWVEAFNAYDTDRTGFLNESEFDYALRKMDINFSKEFIKFLLTKHDPTNRKISLDQFILFCIQAQRFTEEFKARDQNYSGNINLRYEDFLELIMRCF
ncbi:peflin-like [Agrilus planipennis]|uniref:Peflin-like n=1 Tax=Agrilus planipennis TaxID=224129 RepID=A0A1W4XKA6_AGRPL|nr:peflin-like [Agrilus planipennis]